MARSFRTIKARRDTERLKQQRDHKRKKDEIALEIKNDKASEACIEVLFLWHSYEDGKCWLAVEQATFELSKLSGKVAKRNAIKQ